MHMTVQVPESPGTLEMGLVTALSWRVTNAYVGQSVSLCTASRDTDSGGS